MKLKSTKPFDHQLYSPREKVQNYIWIFKIGDPDDKPSVPHGHAKDVGYRLDVWTGNIYPAGKERKNSIGKLKKKELRKLYADQGFIDFAKKQIEWYRETYPHINFYVPDWFVNILRWQSHPIFWNRAMESVIESQSSDGGSHDLCRGSQ